MSFSAMVIIEETTPEGTATGRTLKKRLEFAWPLRKDEEVDLDQVVATVDHVTHVPGSGTTKPYTEIWVELEINDFLSLHRANSGWVLENKMLN